jgi:hypothetical protein
MHKETPNLAPSPGSPPGDGAVRATAAVGLAGVALIHVLDAPNTFPEAPYIGWLYVALIVGCMLTAAALLRTNDPRAWVAAALLPLGAMVGFVVTRTIGLPEDMGDIGNWSEPLGMASLFVEGSVVSLAGLMLFAEPLRRTVQARPARRPRMLEVSR